MADIYAWKLDIDDTRICFARKVTVTDRQDRWDVLDVLYCDDVDSMFGPGILNKLTYEAQEFTITAVKKEV